MASSSAPTIPPPSSSNSSSTPPQPQLQTQTQTQNTPPVDQYNNTNPLIHNVALGVTPLALLALCLPPRRMDLRGIVLGGVALWGTNQLTHDYSGRSFMERFSSRAAQVAGVELPEKAKAVQARMREDKERRARLASLLRDELAASGALGRIHVNEAGVEVWTDEQKKILREAYEKLRRDEQEGRINPEAAAIAAAAEAKKKNQTKSKEEMGVLEKIWMGDADPDWKEKREKREKEALQEGGVGYWGLIAEQIAEVWSGGAKKQEGKSNEDEKKSS